MYSLNYRARNLFYETVKRAGFSKKDTYYFSYNKVFQVAQGNKTPDKKIPEKRKEAFVSIETVEKRNIFSGNNKVDELDKIVLGNSKIIKNSVEGTPAFTGKMQGRVKVILTNDDLVKVEKGDIMIAVMTFPSFIVAMEKASAFVTDEGGILCHAAIVSREMKKPCVIGTKIATKIFKDGNLVEIDAENGVVRKIK